MFADSFGTARIPCTVNICDGSSGPIRDVSEEIATALAAELLETAAFMTMAEESFGDSVLKTAFIYARFYTRVDHSAPWDVKREEVWESTIGTPYPGWDVHVQLGDVSVTPEQIGNITYGIIGYAYGIPLEHLILGSYYAADFPTSGAELGNEVSDWFFVVMGYTAMQSMYQKG